MCCLYHDADYVKSSADGRKKKYKHEDGSVMMLHRLLDSNGIDGIEKKDLTFIEEIIRGKSY